MRSDSSRAELVVDRDPAVPGRRDDRSLRATGEPGDELADRPCDGVQVVALHVHRAEGALARPGDARGKRVERRDQVERLLAEAESRVDRSGGRVVDAHVQREELGARPAHLVDGLRDQALRRSHPPGLRRDVEIAEIADPWPLETSERVAGGDAVVLRDQRDVPPDVALHLAPRLFPGVAPVLGLLDLVHERLPELVQRLAVGLGGTADDHGGRPRWSAVRR